MAPASRFHRPRMAYSPVTHLFRRLSAAHAEAEARGVPVDEVLGEHEEGRQSPDLRQERRRSPGPRQRRRDGPAPEGRMTRREFLRATGATAAGATAASALGALPALSAPRTDARVVIIGAGIAGIRCAHVLQHFGIPSTVFEAADRIGGRTFSATGFFRDGQVAEHGGEFISTEHTATRNLARNLGLRLEALNGGALFEGEEIYYIDGEFYTVAEATADWAVVRKAFKDELQAAPWPQTFDSNTARGRELDTISVPDWFDPGNPLSNPVLAEFGPDSRLGRLLQTNVISEYGGNPGAQPALNLLYLLAWNSRNSISPLPGTDEFHHVAGGNEQLVTRMAEQLPAGSIHLEKPLVAVTGDLAGPYVCTFEDGSTATADYLVLALPFRLLREVALDPRILDALSPQKRDAIANLPMGTNAKLHLQVEERTWARSITVRGEEILPNGVSYSEPGGFEVVWDASVPHPSPRGILVDYVGGTKGTRLRGREPFGPASPADAKAFLSAIDPVFPGTAAAWNGLALQSFWFANPWHKGAYSHWGIGHYTRFAGAEGTQEGNLHFCGEHTSVDFQGFIEGAVRSGKAVAATIHQQV